MSIDKATVARVARLARLKVSDDEQEKLAGELSGILQWIDQLNEVDVTGVLPMTSVVEASLRQRDDVVNDGHITADILANAPSTTADFFSVPKVIE
jgi:aspartyl-tRNA(Asn)/glutamyl-tRNA(Gln) amidotransferase subunit C